MLENSRIEAWWRTIKTAYLARDIGSINQLMPEDRTVDNHELAQLFKERMIDRRNGRMVERMAHRLAEGKTFIAVGALHLPGGGGLLNLLAERGYPLHPSGSIPIDGQLLSPAPGRASSRT